MKKLYIILFANLFMSIGANAQDANAYRKPLDGKLTISANYGELRSNHFHGGIDYKVGGVVGAKVYAVADGYIKRIKVSAYGYGNGLYIQHFDGNISVYGHLNAYNAKISQFVKDLQYKKQSFLIDTTFASESIPIKRGDIIGYAGNSGYSFGPHLHFEIRKDMDTPINPFDFAPFRINDNVMPTFERLYIYTLNNIEGVEIPFKIKEFFLQNPKKKPDFNKAIEVENPLYFGIQCIDNVTDTRNRVGIRTMSVKVDGNEIFAFSLNNIGFDYGRSINSLQQYSLLVGEKHNVIKTYVEDGNTLPVYNNVVNKGLIALTDQAEHAVNITIADDYGNSKSLNFKIKLSDRKTAISAKPANSKAIEWQNGGYILRDSAFVMIPAQALYSNSFIEAEKAGYSPEGLSATYKIGNRNTPLQKSVDVSMSANVPEYLRDKVLFGRYNDKGRLEAYDAVFENNTVRGNLSSFGNYFVIIDTVAPVIRPSFKEKANLQKEQKLKIVISDKLSGIATYNGYIDDQWILFAYDGKNNLLTYTFDNHISANKNHKLKLIVTDGKGNTNTLETTFFR